MQSEKDFFLLGHRCLCECVSPWNGMRLYD
jgi:hypothetical protein